MGAVENWTIIRSPVVSEISGQKLLKFDHPFSNYSRKCPGCFFVQDGDVIRYLSTHGDIIHVPDPEMHLVSFFA